MDPLSLAGRPINRIGYGAMQLEKVDRSAATAVLRRAVELGVNHLDTASFYGDATVNEHIRAALTPYPADLVIVSKVGARHIEGDFPLELAQRPHELRSQIHRDLATLGLDQVPIVNLRRADQGPGLIASGVNVVPIDDQLAELIALRDEGLIGAIGLSNVSTAQIEHALPVGIVCVQNAYGVLDRTHEDELALCAAHGIAWVPYFPLGSAFPQFPSPNDHPIVGRIAGDHGVTPAAIALAWLLAHSNHIAPIPGTRSIAHLEENLSAADVVLTADELAELDGLSQTS
ncbi:aldo/keto reductase [Kribbella sp. NPDC005582]|uniref:aldo/keto reductase n=1 Tax=Kribbella sp. NPDC005582 TaxID=3156893 RepID=UPI0033A0D48D